MSSPLYTVWNSQHDTIVDGADDSGPDMFFDIPASPKFGDLGPGVSFDMSASPEYLSGLACASLTEIEPTVTLFRAIPDYMSWRHPDSAIDDPKPSAGSFNMEDVHRLSAYVVKLRDMPEGVLVLSGLMMGIHDFLCLSDWTGAEVQEEPHHDIRPTLQKLPFYCTLPTAVVDAVISDPTLKDLTASNLSAKVFSKDEASQTRMASTFGAASRYVAKRTRSVMAQSSAGQKKPEAQWTADERKAANLDQRLKSLIMSVLPDDQMNSVINCLTVNSTWDDLILYHEGPSDVKESRVMDLKLCYSTFKFKESESLTETFTRYKALMNKLVNDGIKLSKLEINTGFINGLSKKCLSFCQSLRNTNHVKDSELASLCGKLKYEENRIDNIYETKKRKSLVFATPLSTTFFSTSIVRDFPDSPDDEEDTRSSHEYLNDLEEEYQAKSLLAKSKRFFKKGT
nr:retrovirus-related Pol polyprotein from transposon TNT 1-94 [Tanacetum cinerariifolium]